MLMLMLCYIIIFCTTGSSFYLLKEGKYQFQLVRTGESSKKAKSEGGGGGGHWSQGLLSSMNDPEYLLLSTADFVIIRDKYPKSKHHFLVIPKKPINKIDDLVKEDEKLLEDMEAEARGFVTKYSESEFLFGYHSQPSMSQLHLHVISSDFVSDCLKHKKHWNSFNTDFFLSSQSVIHQLKEEGRVRTPTSGQAKDLLSLPLKCNQCGNFPKNIPDLKRHLKDHLERKRK